LSDIYTLEGETVQNLICARHWNIVRHWSVEHHWTVGCTSGHFSIAGHWSIAVAISMFAMLGLINNLDGRMVERVNTTILEISYQVLC